MHFVSNIYIRGLRGDPYIRDDVWSAVVRFRCGVLKFGHGIVQQPALVALVQCKRLLLKLWLLEERKITRLIFFVRTCI